MPISVLGKTLSNACFPETTAPYDSFVDERKNWIGIANSYWAQWTGRYVPMRSSSLLFYDMDSLELIGCVDQIEHPINDLCVHPESKVAAIATGQYDGGAYYEGGLFLWDADTGELRSVFTDSREVRQCAFIDKGRKLQFVVSPTDDLDDPSYFETTYEIDYPCSPGVSLEQLTPVSVVHIAVDGGGEGYEARRDLANQRLARLAAKAGRHYVNKSMLWDLLFLDDNHIVAARNNATIEIWNTQTIEVREIRMPEEGTCVQVFLNSSKQALLVNCWFRDRAQDRNVIYSVPLSSLVPEEIIRCNHCLSRSSNDYFLARQIGFHDRTIEDFILDPNYNIVYISRLGHYDLFNHYLRIDDRELLYFLVGDPSEGNENKIFCSIDPVKGKVKRLWQIEKQPVHFNELNGVMEKGILILSGTRFGQGVDYSEIFAIDLVAGSLRRGWGLAGMGSR